MEKKSSILLVEDNPPSLELMKKHLEADGHQVFTAVHGRAAMAILNTTPVPLVVTDWLMPEMDGLDLCRHIRQAAFESYVYIIMVTSRTRKQDLVAVFEAGADDYIPKPVDPEELKARVQTGLRLIALERRYQETLGQMMQGRSRLEIVFDAIQEEIIVIDANGKVISVNGAFLRRTGLKRKTAIGYDYPAFLDTQLVPVVKRAFEEGQRQDYLLKLCSGDGADDERQVTAVPIQDDHRQTSIVVVVMKDVTEDRRHAKQIQSLNKRLIQTAVQLEVKNKKLETTLHQLEETQVQMLQAEKMASIGQLAAGVAHEINNPTGFVSSNLKTLHDYTTDMAAVITQYQTLRDRLLAADAETGLGPDLKPLVEDIVAFEAEADLAYVLSDTAALLSDCREGTERIKKIVSDLKDFAHPGSDKLQLVDVNAGLDSTLNVVHNELKYKAEVRRLFGDVPAVYAYPQQLNQVFVNILVNAAQSIEKQGTIAIATRAGNGHVVVEIADSGCGIPAENVSKIFDPFFTTKDVGKGTGLGMHIVYNIIQKHRGTITVQSKVGEGTTFTISIPMAPPDAADESDGIAPDKGQDASPAES